MDTGLGDFTQISEGKAKTIEETFRRDTRTKTLKSGIFREGEQVELKGSKFSIFNIGRHTLTLRLLADFEQNPLLRKQSPPTDS